MLALGDGALHPRLAGGNEDHLVEVELLLHLARGHEVAVVDGIERAAHDADARTAVLVGSSTTRAALVARAVRGRRDAAAALSLWRFATSR